MPASLGLLLLLFAVPAQATDDNATSEPEAVAGLTQAATPENHAAEETSAQDAGLAWAVEGYLRQDLRYRHVNSEDDLDLYTYVYGDARRGGKVPIHIRINGRLVADVAGNQAPGDLLRDIWDSFSGDVQFRLYEAFAETGKLFDSPLSIRAGRQFLDEGLYLHFDGGRVDYDLGKVLAGASATAVFGVPVKFGETSRTDNWLAGLVVRGKLTERTRGRFEYYHVSEFFDGINDPVVDPLHQPESFPPQHLDDDYLGFTFWHRVLENLRAYLRFTLLNGDANELHVRLRWFTPDGRWTVVGEWYQLFNRLRNVTNDLTPFVPMLGSYEAFYRVGVRATYRPDEHWIFQGGYSHRELDDESDESTFNHEYNSYYASGSYLGLLDGSLDLTLVATGYNSSRNETAAVSGHAAYRLNGEIDLSGGVDYSYYKYDFFLNTEREDVWTYWVKARWKLAKKITLDGQVSIDNDRFDTYTTILVRVTVRW